MILNKVADLMETKGHTRFKLTNVREGGYCVLGAMYKADTGKEPESHSVYIWGHKNLSLLEKVAERLKIVQFPPWLTSYQRGTSAWKSIIDWSNNTSTLEVLCRLRRAGAEEEAEALEKLDFEVEEPVLVDA